MAEIKQVKQLIESNIIKLYRTDKVSGLQLEQFRRYMRGRNNLNTFFKDLFFGKRTKDVSLILSKLPDKSSFSWAAYVMVGSVKIAGDVFHKYPSKGDLTALIDLYNTIAK